MRSTDRPSLPLFVPGDLLSQYYGNTKNADYSSNTPVIQIAATLHPSILDILKPVFNTNNLL